jgi:hypothetical protein
METLTLLFIHTAWRAQSHQWSVNDDGLVEYRGQLVEPREVYERFPIDYPMFQICRVEVCRRTTNPDPNAAKPYVWETLELFQGG